MKELSTYTAATAGAGNYPFGLVNNETSPGAQDGTPVNASLWNDSYQAFYALLVDMGIVPSGAQENTETSDFLDALKLAVKAPTYNPFTNSAYFVDEVTSGTAAQSISSDTWTARTNLAQKWNNIADASVAAGVITLPAGTYIVSGYSTIRNPSGSIYSKSAVFETATADVTNLLVTGTTASIYTDDRAGDSITSFFEDTFTLGSASTITMQHHSNRSTVLGVPYDLTDYPEVYAAIKVTKMD